MFTKGAQCTGNFVFKDRVGRVYVGYAAHCAGRGAATDTNGCNTRSHPIGTRVRFAKGATLATNGTTVGGGTLVYSSWIKMRQRNTRSRAACAANDFALVRVDRNDRRKVNPSVPFWGGPDRPLHRRGAGRHPGLLLGPVQPAAHDRPLSEDRGPHSAGPTAAGAGRSTPRPRASPVTPAAGSSTPAAAPSGPCPRSSSPPRRQPTAWATCSTSCASRRGSPASAGCAWCAGPRSSPRFLT